MYIITKKGDMISIRFESGYSDIENKVFCNWSRLISNREYIVYINYAKSDGEALDRGKSLIENYINNYNNPMVTIKEVIEGKKDGASYEEIFHTICEALLVLEKKQLI